MGLSRTVLTALVPVLLLGGCTRAPMLPNTLALPGHTLTLPGAPAVTDGRSEFRALFCALLAARDWTGGECADLLPRLGDEPQGTRHRPGDTAAAANLKLILVPGLYDECIRDLAAFYGPSAQWLRERGYDVEILGVNSRSGNRRNARQIADYLQALPPGQPERLVLLGHSKGAADILHTLVEHPETANRVTAVVSVAGAINGSPLADRALHSFSGWDALIPAALCDPGDRQALSSLTRRDSLIWLSRHPLPPGPRYFSLAAISDPDHVAWPLLYGYQRLAEIDPRNDGLLLASDQVIPGAELLGYVAADHWRVAYPVEGQAALLSRGRTPVPAFPRHLLLEAILIHVAQALGNEVH
jgi:hypothetical protein